MDFQLDSTVCSDAADQYEELPFFQTDRKKKCSFPASFGRHGFALDGIFLIAAIKRFALPKPFICTALEPH